MGLLVALTIDSRHDTLDAQHSAHENAMDRKYVPLGLALGTALGALLGAAIGAVTGKPAIGVSVGMGMGVAIGIALGAAIGSAQHKHAGSSDDDMPQRPEVPGRGHLGRRM